MFNFLALWALAPLIATQSVKRVGRYLASPALVIVLALVCALQPPETNSDRSAYSLLIDAAASSSWLSVPIIEPGFYLIVKLAQLMQSAVDMEFAVYFMTALISVSLKLKLFRQYGGSVTYCLLLFISYFFLLHEATQIRIGVAISLMYFAFFYWLEGRRWRSVAFVALAMCFHYSAIALFPMVALAQDGWRHKTVLTMGALGAVAAAAIVAGSLYLAAFTSVAELLGISKILFYLEVLQEGTFDKVNFINRLAPHAVLLTAFMVTRRFWRDDKGMELLYLTYIYGMLIFIILSPFPLMAYRISDIFLFSSVLLAGRVVYHLRDNKLAYHLYSLFIIVYSAGFTLYSIFLSPIFIR